jgi:N-acetyl-anhydromuramyl-L-alanine amidase AmpD
VVHHSALPDTEGPRQIQDIHMRERGFADIGYHFVIDRRGNIFEGRTIAVRGSHTGGRNYGTIGVVLLGDFENTQPTNKQWESTRLLVHCLAVNYGLTHLAGHREFQPERTVCPGRHLESRLPELASELGLVYGTEGYVGPGNS